MAKLPVVAFVVLLAGVVLLAPQPLGAQACSDCHDNKPASHTAHENVDCANCHLEHAEFPHPESAATATCDMCHSQEADQTALGVHGQERQRGNEAAPDCSLCHGSAHNIELPGTTRFRRATVETCGMCHSDEAEQFKQSVHGSLLANETTREGPTCNTCHGEHQIQRPAALEQTVREFNAAVRPGTFNPGALDGCKTEGIDPPKTHWARVIDQPPFLGYPLRPGITFTYLGVKVDENARVLMEQGGPCSNLFAAGEIMAGNILGAGYMAGVGMTIGSVFGRIAGREAARLARH